MKNDTIKVGQKLKVKEVKKETPTKTPTPTASKTYKVKKNDVQSIIVLYLKYGEKKERVITGLKRISKPGLRVYAKAQELPRVLNGLGIAIISTSHGVMTDRDARNQSLGGEVMAYIW